MNAQKPFSKARWIWTKGENRRPFHASLFRSGFSLAQKAKAALLAITADSKYRLYVNGRYAGFGPARSSAKHPYYDAFEISHLLKKGNNALAVIVQHYTDGAGIFQAVQGGLICQMENEKGEILSATGDQWKCLSSNAFSSVPGFLFPEIFDARQEPENWIAPDFDDSSWEEPVILNNGKLAPPDDILPRPIPPLTETLCNPIKILDIGVCIDKETKGLREEQNIAQSLARSQREPLPKGNVKPSLSPLSPWSGKSVTLTSAGKDKPVFISLDFGKNLLACPVLKIEGAPGTLVDIGYSEILENNRVATMRQNIPLHDRMILKQGVTEHRFFQPRGFRFMMIRFAEFEGDLKIRNISAIETIYPAKEKGKFQCSDSLLNDIFKISARTVNLCMEDSYTDCPWRERCQWLGDFHPEALFSYYCFGSYDIARKAVREYAMGNTLEGWIPGVFPVTKPFNLPTWGMRFPVIAWEYYLYTGDIETLDFSYDSVQKMMGWLAQYVNKEGLLDSPPGWNFVDWTKTDAGNGDGAIQGWYLDALDKSALIARELGDVKMAKSYETNAGILRKSIASSYWSKEKKAFLKYTPKLNRRPEYAPPDLLGQHENFIFPLLEVGSPAMRRQALNAAKGKVGKYLPDIGGYQNAFLYDQTGNVSAENIILIGSPFWSFYALLSLLEAKEDIPALEYIRIGWGLMLENGSTSCWEMWDRHTSMCHGWSAAPAMILPAYVLGVKPVKPGFVEFEIAPRIFDLNWAKGEIPTPQGSISVSWKIEKNNLFTIEIKVPKDTVCNLLPPDGYAKKGEAKLQAAAGRHKFQFKRKMTP
ncbi:family 78 glycoside hydrolase catalytic domain [Candidatus Sumerlaeota bacterium]|nr:family 78 glycoside hydrolase catalytic domain [Candidatus Sumerlaeota bacterium]